MTRLVDDSANLKRVGRSRLGRSQVRAGERASESYLAENGHGEDEQDDDLDDERRPGSLPESSILT